MHLHRAGAAAAALAGRDAWHASLLVVVPAGGCSWLSDDDIDVAFANTAFSAVQFLDDVIVPPRCAACLKLAAMHETPYGLTLAVEDDSLGTLTEFAVAAGPGAGMAAFLPEDAHDFEFAALSCRSLDGRSGRATPRCAAESLSDGRPCLDTGLLLLRRSSAAQRLLAEWFRLSRRNCLLSEAGFPGRAPGVPPGLPQRAAEWLAAQDALPLSFLASPLKNPFQIHFGVLQPSSAVAANPGEGASRRDAMPPPDNRLCETLVVVDHTKMVLWDADSDGQAWQKRMPHLEYGDFWDSPAVQAELGGVCLFRMSNLYPAYLGGVSARIAFQLQEFRRYAPMAEVWIFESSTHHVLLALLDARRAGAPAAAAAAGVRLGFSSHTLAEDFGLGLRARELIGCDFVYAYEVASARRLLEESHGLVQPVVAWLHPRLGFAPLWQPCFGSDTCGSEPTEACWSGGEVSPPYVFTGGSGWSRDFSLAILATRVVGVPLHIATWGANETLEAVR